MFAGLFHETHTFVEGTTRLRDFQILRGKEMLRCDGDSSPIGGALESARKFGWTILPTVDFRASPSAVVEDEVVETFWHEFEFRAKPELAKKIDAIYLVLHLGLITVLAIFAPAVLFCAFLLPLSIACGISIIWDGWRSFRL